MRLPPQLGYRPYGKLGLVLLIVVLLAVSGRTQFYENLRMRLLAVRNNEQIFKHGETEL